MSNNSLNNYDYDYIASDPTLSARMNSINSNYASDVKKLDADRQRTRTSAHTAHERLLKYIPEILASRGLAGNVAISESSLIDANNKYNNALNNSDLIYNEGKETADKNRDANLATLYSDADTKRTTDRNTRYTTAENTIKNWSGTQEELDEFILGLSDDDWGEGMYDSLINLGKTWKDTQAKNDQNSAYDTAKNILDRYGEDYSKDFASVSAEIQPFLDRMNANQKAEITAALNVYDQKYQSSIMNEAIEKIDNSDSWSEMMEIAASTSLKLSRVNGEALRKYVDEYGENIADTNKAAKITADSETKTIQENSDMIKRVNEAVFGKSTNTKGVADEIKEGDNIEVTAGGYSYEVEIGKEYTAADKQNIMTRAKNNGIGDNQAFLLGDEIYLMKGETLCKIQKRKLDTGISFKYLKRALKGEDVFPEWWIELLG